MAVLQGAAELIGQPLYDTASVATSGTTTLTFFQNPIGQGTTVYGSGAKWLRDTNMRTAGVLPQGFTFEVRAIALAALSTAATQAADLAIALAGAAFSLLIGSKTQFEIPAIALPGGCGVEGFAATTATTTTIQGAHSGVGDPRAVYVLPVPIKLESQLNFSAQLTWNTAPAPTAAVPVTLFLHGILSRPVQ